MTRQIPDRLTLEGAEQVISPIDLTESPWPHVRRYISSVRKFPACWRGYHCKWDLRNRHLFLVDMTIMWSGRQAWLTFNDVFPRQLTGVPASWFSGEIEVPQGERIALGHDFWMHEQTLTLSFALGVLMGSAVRDNRQAAAAEAQRLTERYAPLRKSALNAKARQAFGGIDEEPKTAIEAQCDEFMMAAMMGVIDKAAFSRWRRFHEAVDDSASPADAILLELVNTVVQRLE